jgi:hypothetical protein
MTEDRRPIQTTTESAAVFKTGQAQAGRKPRGEILGTFTHPLTKVIAGSTVPKNSAGPLES